MPFKLLFTQRARGAARGSTTPPMAVPAACLVALLTSSWASAQNHTKLDVEGWNQLVESGSFPATSPLPPDAAPGGILLYALGRVGSESFYHAIRSVSSGAIAAAFDSYGGETFKETGGVPVAGLNLSIGSGYRYTHVKPIFVRFGLGKPARAQNAAELMREARAAGFTMVVAIDRTNELSQYLSDLEFNCKKSDDCAQRHEQLCQGEDTFLDELELRRREVRAGLAAALSAGLPVFLSTFEDVVTDSCALAQSVLHAYNSLLKSNKRARLVPIHARACEGNAIVSSATNFSALTLRDRLGEGPYACLLRAMRGRPEFSWMMEEAGKRMRPPTTWRSAFDGLMPSRASKNPSVFSSSAVAAQAAEAVRLYPHAEVSFL